MAAAGASLARPFLCPPHALQTQTAGGLALAGVWSLQRGCAGLRLSVRAAANGPYRDGEAGSGGRGGSEEEREGNLQFFATCAPGVEDLVAAELESARIGATGVQAGSSGVAFCGSMATGYRANLWLRCAVRVLLRLAAADLDPRAAAGDSVYEFMRSTVKWADLVNPTEQAGRGWKNGSKGPLKPSLQRPENGSVKGFTRLARTFSVESRVWDCESVSNSRLVTTRAKDAICDALRDSYGGVKPEPPMPGECADLPLFLSLFRERAVLYRDMSGASLHKRGYRDVMHRASLSEGIAAALLMRAKWRERIGLLDESEEKLWNEGERAHRSGGSIDSNRRPPKQPHEHVLLDPMCGSGTLLIEAALIATNHAPGLFRSEWPFQFWPDYSPQLWTRSLEEAEALKRAAPEGLRLLGNDIHGGALSLCERDARTAGVLHHLELSCSDCAEYRPPVSPSLVVVNPPWGARLGQMSGEEAHWLSDTWQSLGRFLKAECSGADVFVLSGNRSITSELRMRAAQKWPVVVGGVECRMLHYNVLPPKPQGEHPAEHVADRRKQSSGKKGGTVKQEPMWGDE